MTVGGSGSHASLVPAGPPTTRAPATSDGCRTWHVGALFPFTKSDKFRTEQKRSSAAEEPTPSPVRGQRPCFPVAACRGSEDRRVRLPAGLWPGAGGQGVGPGGLSACRALALGLEHPGRLTWASLYRLGVSVSRVCGDAEEPGKLLRDLSHERVVPAPESESGGVTEWPTRRAAVHPTPAPPRSPAAS